MADDAQEQMVRADSVASRAHGFFTGIFNDLVEVFRDLQLHRLRFARLSIKNRTRGAFCHFVSGMEKMRIFAGTDFAR